MSHGSNGVRRLGLTGLLAAAVLAACPWTVDAADGKKKVVFVAGRPSHGYGAHEHNAGCLLLSNMLRAGMPNFDVEVVTNGWPEDQTVFNGADSVVMYCDGGGGHMVNKHLKSFDELMKKGVGVVCIHYAVETPKGESGDYFLDWLGGYFEANWSVNPHWTAKFEKLPDHPIARGVKPFEINDEWYFHMRFREGMKGVTPILTAIAPEETMRRGDGPHSGNPHVRKAVAAKEPQHMAWAAERPDGGRGFGFTGGHFHWNWRDDNFRKVVLNAVVWTAKGEVPADGVPSGTPSQEVLEQNQDFPKPGEKKPAPKKEVPKKEEAKQSQAQPLKAAQVSAKAPEGPAVNDPRHASKAVEQLDAPQDVQASLFAAEPLLLSPSDIDVDHLGRVWVCEVVNYRGRNGERPEGDRILILEDTDKDGKADKQTVFYQGRDVDSALGICVLGNKVIVSAAPNVFVFTDENGDGKADKKELLFTETSQPQHDHSAHAFVFGPDGKLYWNFGNTGKGVSDKDGKQVVDLAGNPVKNNGSPYREGMVFRCNLDGGQLETLGWNFRNNYEVAVDSFGSLWQSDNDDDGNRGVRINFVMEFGNYGYKDEMTGAGWKTPRTNMEKEIPLQHWHLNDPGVVPNLLQTGAGSPTGICVYEGSMLPERFRGQVVHCDAGPNIVRAYPAKKAGAGYTAEIANLLEGKRDTWFRPADVCTAPDGSLIVADWYDPGVGGHRMGDVDKGRLFRLAAPGAKYSAPKYDFSTIAGSIEALKSPNQSARYLAWQSLHAQGAKAEPALLEMFTQSTDPRMQARALWLLGKIPGRGAHYVETAVKLDDADLRIVGLRLARQLGLASMPLLSKLSNDPAPEVRRETAVALRGRTEKEAAAVWADLALKHDGQDRWYLEALGIAADKQWDSFFAAWRERAGDQWNSPAGRDVVWRSRASAALPLLAQLIADPNTPEAELPRYFRAFDFHVRPEDKAAKEAALVALLNARGDSKVDVRYLALERLSGVDAKHRPELDKAVGQALASAGNPSQFIALVKQFRVEAKYGELLKLAQKHPREQIGVEALQVLLSQNQRDLVQAGLASSDVPTAVATAQALASTGDIWAVRMMSPLLADAGRPMDVRREAARAMAANRTGAQELIKLAKAGKLDEQLRFTAALPLNAAPWEEVRREAVKLFPPPAAKGNSNLPPLAQLLKMKGNAANGKLVFQKADTCANCHVVNGQGKSVGPELSEIGSKLSREAFFESILYPSAGISHNFESYDVVLTSGTIATGLLVSETADEVRIKGIDAVERTFPKSDVDEMVKKKISLMPADLQKTMTAQELVDVVDYMQTLKKATASAQ